MEEVLLSITRDKDKYEKMVGGLLSEKESLSKENESLSKKVQELEERVQNLQVTDRKSKWRPALLNRKQKERRGDRRKHKVPNVFTGLSMDKLQRKHEKDNGRRVSIAVTSQMNTILSGDIFSNKLNLKKIGNGKDKYKNIVQNIKKNFCRDFVIDGNRPPYI